MTRKIRNPPVDDVSPETAIVAPHRYLWAGTIRPDGQPAKDLDLCEIREEYHVQYATKAGTWSRVWIMAYPGTIQRGYQRAGLAPDLENTTR